MSPGPQPALATLAPEDPTGPVAGSEVPWTYIGALKKSECSGARFIKMLCDNGGYLGSALSSEEILYFDNCGD